MRYRHASSDKRGRVPFRNLDFEGTLLSIMLGLGSDREKQVIFTTQNTQTPTHTTSTASSTTAMKLTAEQTEDLPFPVGCEYIVVMVGGWAGRFLASERRLCTRCVCGGPLLSRRGRGGAGALCSVLGFLLFDFFTLTCAHVAT